MPLPPLHLARGFAHTIEPTTHGAPSSQKDSVDLHARHALPQTPPTPQTPLTPLTAEFLQHNKIYRQELLKPTPAVRGYSNSYLSSYQTKITTHDDVSLRLVLHYVPDRYILTLENFEHYLRQIQSLAVHQEEFLLIVLDDINNQVVPRWLMLLLHVQTATTSCRLAAEDQQPGWQRSQIVQRILLSMSDPATP